MGSNRVNTENKNIEAVKNNTTGNCNKGHKTRTINTANIM